MNVVRTSALGTGRLYPQKIFLVFIYVRGWVDSTAIPKSPSWTDPSASTSAPFKKKYFLVFECYLQYICSRTLWGKLIAFKCNIVNYYTYLFLGKVNMELQLDATITVFIDLLDQLNTFRANICPSSGAQELVFYSIWYNVLLCGRQGFPILLLVTT
jgi:hypothetical protein